MGEVNKRLAMFVLLSVLTLLLSTVTVSAEIKTVTLDLEKLLHMKAEKIIYSDDGVKFAILVQDNVPAKQRKQAIYLYDFAQNSWSRGAELSLGLDGDLEPLDFSADGSKLVFRLKEDLMIIDTVDLQITHHIQQVGSLSEAAFSPDGKYLAFLMNAEWETPTSLFLFDLESTDTQQSLIPCAVYMNENKAAGPLNWTNDSQGVYFIQEFTWGTINSQGILKKYDLTTQTVSEVYNIKAPTARISHYYYSSSGEYRAMIIRDLDNQLANSRYGLTIQKDDKFIYGIQLENWRDPVEPEVTQYLSSAGFLGERYFYWITRDEQGSKVYMYDIKVDYLFSNTYPEQVQMTPAGILIKMVK